MADDLTEKCSFLNLGDDEGDIVDLREVENVEENGKLELLLVGRLLTERPYNMEAFKRTMQKVWTPSHNLIIRAIGPNLFAFQFLHWRDKEKVMNGRPWCWENNLVVLNEIKGDELPKTVNLNFSPFWIRVRNLPFNCRSDAYVRALTKDIGEFIEIEEDVLGLERYRRIRIAMDITKPIRRNQKIKDRGGNVVIVNFKYERLPYFCLACGVIGHSERDCVVVSEEEKEKKMGWTLSLRASPRKGFTKEAEEWKEITKGKRQLSVTKQADSSWIRKQSSMSIGVRNVHGGLRQNEETDITQKEGRRKGRDETAMNVVRFLREGPEVEVTQAELQTEGSKVDVIVAKGGSSIVESGVEVEGSDTGLSINIEPVLTFAVGTTTNTRKGLRKVKKVERHKGGIGNKEDTEGGKQNEGVGEKRKPVSDGDDVIMEDGEEVRRRMRMGFSGEDFSATKQVAEVGTPQPREHQ